MREGSTVFPPPPGLRQATRRARCRFIDSNSPSASEKQAALARVLSVIVLLSCIAGFGLAQNTNSGDIRGIVTDATGAVIPGATVTILNVNTGVAKSLITNQAGLYDAVSILPGRYRLTFSKGVSRSLCAMV